MQFELNAKNNYSITIEHLLKGIYYLIDLKNIKSKGVKIVVSQ
jgi:hypothetical protein